MGYWESFLRETGLEKINIGNEIRKSLVSRPDVRNLAERLGPAAERLLYGENEWQARQTAVTKAPTPEEQAVVELEAQRVRAAALDTAARATQGVQRASVRRLARVAPVAAPSPYQYGWGAAWSAFSQPSLWWGGWF